MPSIVIDNDLYEKLRWLCQVTKLCSADGQILGRFVPEAISGAWEPITPEITKEELDRRGKGTKWYSTAEVLEHLNQLGCK